MARYDSRSSLSEQFGNRMLGVCRRSMLENDDIEKGGLWELGLLAQRARAELSVDEKTENMHRQLRYGVSLWRCLEEKLIEEGGEDVSDKVDQIQGLVTALESQISVNDMRKGDPKNSKSKRKRRN